VQTVHEWLAILALATAVACLGTATAWWFSGRSARVFLDRLLLLQLAALFLALFTGGAVVIANGIPRDPLHILYGVVVFVPLPLARYLGRTGSPRRRSGYLALGALTTVGLVTRLFQTGG